MRALTPYTLNCSMANIKSGVVCRRSYESVVPEEGFEPPTSASEARRSDPLSYSGIVTYTMVTDILTERELRQ